MLHILFTIFSGLAWERLLICKQFKVLLFVLLVFVHKFKYLTHLLTSWWCLIRHYIQYHKYQPHGGVRGNVLWPSCMSGPNLMATYPIVVDTFQSGATWRADGLTDRHGHPYNNVSGMAKNTFNDTSTWTFTDDIPVHLWTSRFQLSQMLLSRRKGKNNGQKKGVEIKKDGAYLDTVSFRQDVPERVVKLIEIHLMASPQQSLVVRSKSHFQALTEQPKKILFYSQAAYKHIRYANTVYESNMESKVV